jgi:hypothetical protein
MGAILLPTCLAQSAALAKLAVSLDKRPELTASLVRRHSVRTSIDDSSGSLKTLVEDTAELLQRAFTTCLADRSGTGASGRPEGKRAGIYSFANLVLKLLFQVSREIISSFFIQQDLPLLAVK